MVRDISGLGSPSRNELRTDRSSSNGSSATENTASPSVSSSASTADQVELSSQATSLKSLENKLSSLSDVDEERVAAIKAAVDSGEYTIDNEKLAGNILDTNALFN